MDKPSYTCIKVVKSMRSMHSVIRRKRRKSKHDIAVFQLSWTLVLWIGLLFFHHFLPEPLEAPFSLIVQILFLLYCLYFSFSSLPSYYTLLRRLGSFLQAEYTYMAHLNKREKKHALIHEIPQSSAHFK